MERTLPLILGAAALVASPLQAMDTGTIYLTVNGQTREILLCDNSSAKALAQELAKGGIRVSMEDYGNFEKVGPLPRSLPRNDTHTTTAPGDVILYQGNKLCIYYARNTWSFTRLGKINLSAAEMKKLLGPGDVNVSLSLSKPE